MAGKRKPSVSSCKTSSALWWRKARHGGLQLHQLLVQVGGLEISSERTLAEALRRGRTGMAQHAKDRVLQFGGVAASADKSRRFDFVPHAGVSGNDRPDFNSKRTVLQNQDLAAPVQGDHATDANPVLVGAVGAILQQGVQWNERSEKRIQLARPVHDDGRQIVDEDAEGDGLPARVAPVEADAAQAHPAATQVAGYPADR